MQKQKILVAALIAALGAIPASAQSTGPTGQWRTIGAHSDPVDDQQGPGDNRGQPQSRSPGDRQQGLDGTDDGRRGDVGVARVSVADGDVEVNRGDTGDRMQARGGMPLAGNDTIATGRSSRAEVQLGPGNLVRLGEESRVRIVDVGNRYFRVEVLSGTVNVSQLRGGEADIDVMTPNTTVRPLKTGVYRVLVREAQTDLTVRKGEAEVVSSRGGEKVKSGQRASVRGPRQNPEFRIAGADPKDSFDRWNERRDDVLEPRSRTGGVLFGGGYGPYGGYGYPFWGPSFGLGYGYGGFYGGSTVIIGGRGGFGGGRGGGGRGRR